MSQVTVGSATPVQIIAGNPQRISLIICNTHSSANLYVGASSAVTTVTAGMVIVAGGNYTEDSGGEKLYLGDYYGLAGEGVIDTRYWERTK